MENSLNFKFFLFISKKRFVLSGFSEMNQNIYREEFTSDHNRKDLNFTDLSFFLNEHVFKVEKKIKNFIKKISIILETEDFLPIEICLKKNNYINSINFKNLVHLLNDGKDYCKKTIGDRRIVHMIIENYQIDNNFYSFLPKEIKAKSFSIDVKIICISNDVIKNFEMVLRKFQISLGRVVNANYISKFLKNNDDIFLMAQKIINGHNPNEIKLVEKVNKNQGFYEKFFNFFN